MCINIGGIKLQLKNEDEKTKTFIVNDSIIILTNIFFTVFDYKCNSEEEEEFYKKKELEIQRYIKQYLMLKEIKKMEV